MNDTTTHNHRGPFSWSGLRRRMSACAAPSSPNCTTAPATTRTRVSGRRSLQRWRREDAMGPTVAREAGKRSPPTRVHPAVGGAWDSSSVGGLDTGEVGDSPGSFVLVCWGNRTLRIRGIGHETGRQEVVCDGCSWCEADPGGVVRASGSACPGRRGVGRRGVGRRAHAGQPAAGRRLRGPGVAAMASTHTGAHRGLVAGDQCWLVSMTSDAVAPSMQGQAFGVDDAVGVDAICADGGIVHLRPVVPEDADALRDLHQGVSDYSLYMRFFGLSRSAAITYVTRLVAVANPEHQAMSAWIGDRLIGVAAFERTGVDTAEVALLVADDHHRQGIGTLLLEHLAARARSNGITRFVADVLGENYLALRTLRDMGCQTTIRREGGTALVEIDLHPDARTIAVIDGRERTAEEASLRHVLAPVSVAVIGAGIHPDSVGHQVLRNILAAGFVGTVHAVNPHHDSVLGVPCVPTPAQLPDAVDLAIVAVPAAQVPTVVGACGERNVRAVLVLTAGFGETGDTGMALEQRVVRIARHYGMRVVGPNCLGLVNTDPAVRLNATFADIPMNPGGLGLVSQSGALGIAVLAAANRDGLGTAQFVSIGNKADVSSNDLLLAWEGDHRVRVIALYLESLGNPRKFARIARRVASTKPIIAIKAGRSPAGQRAGQSHTAAAASSDVVIEALFRQAGVLRVNTMQEMLDTARVLCEQPLPAGPRVAVVGNSGGPEILAADAASSAGLELIQLASTTEQLLRH